MGFVEKTVFISYRRANLPWALAIYQNLRNNGFDVFFDYQSIRSGDFERTIIGNIKNRAHFLVILTPSALERCKEPGDWLRREIETAIEEKRNIVPLILESFDFDSPSVTKILIGKLEKLKNFNGLEIPSAYFFEAMDRLRNEYLNVALDDLVLQPLSTEVESSTESQQEIADEALPVKQDQLTAQEWFERGYLYSESNNSNDAIRCYKKSLELDPEGAGAYYNMGIHLKRIECYDEAEDAFRSAIELDPDYSDAFYNLGNLLSDLERFNEAISAYRKAIELGPADSAAYYNLGNQLFEIEHFDEAEVAYRMAIELKPNVSIYYNNLGNVLSKLGCNFEAEEAYQKAIELACQDAVAYSNLGNLLVETDRIEEAEIFYRKSIDLDPHDAVAHYTLGNLLEKTERFDEAEIFYRKSIILNPHDAVAHYNFGLLLEKTDRIEEAEILYRRSIDLDPLNPDAYFNLGILLDERKHYEEAEALFRKAIELDPKNADSYYCIACIKSKIDEAEEAFYYLDVAIQKGQDKTWAWEDPDLGLLRKDERFVSIVGPNPKTMK